MLGMFALQVAFPQYAVHGINMKGLTADAISIATQLAKKKSPPQQSVTTSSVPESALHLKSFCSMLGHDTILLGGIMGLALQHHIRGIFSFEAYHTVHVPDMAAANCVAANGRVLRRAGVEFPASERVWQSLGDSFGEQVQVNCSELSKVDGAITCCSVLFNSKS